MAMKIARRVSAALKDLARLFADAFESRKEVTLSSESCKKLFLAMTTLPEADRAARPVANKAEVEQLRHEHKCMADAIRDAAVKAGICRDDVCLTEPHLLMLCDDMASVINRATPPATTGAIPEELAIQLLNALAGRDPKAYKALSDFIFESSKSAGASTVLTDERIERDFLKHWDSVSHDYGFHKEFDTAREVAAQAGQVAVPEAVDGVRWDLFPGYLIDHCEGDLLSEEGLQHALSRMLKDPQYLAAIAAAPSPAKESK
jgi:hypothetical protein